MTFWRRVLALYGLAKPPPPEPPRAVKRRTRHDEKRELHRAVTPAPKPADAPMASQPAPSASRSVLEEAREALAALGYRPGEAKRLTVGPYPATASAQDIIRDALRKAAPKR